MMKQWRTVILSKFGRRAKRSWFSAALDFQLVDLGMKPSCLFDHWAVSPEDMESFTLDLHQQHLTNNKINVINIGLDVVIYKSGCDQHNLENRNELRLFVDISSSLQNPVVADNDMVINTTNVFIKLCDTLNKTYNTQGCAPVFNVEVSDKLNGPCLYGLLLGYPCVYWYDTTKIDEHCLSGQVLQLFQVKGQLKSDFVNGTPMTSKTFTTVSSKQEKIDDKTCLSGDCHVIFSFTVPVCVLSSVQEHVKNWFQKWKNLALWPHMFSDIWLEEKSVSPHSVCL